MPKVILIGEFAVALLLSTFSAAQQTQSGTPAEPTPSIYNRMRRFPGANQGPNQQNQQQQTVQTQQFPNAQFPPEQQAAPGQRPPMTFPHANGPMQQAPAPTTQTPQPSNQPAPQPQAPQTPYGLALQPANAPRISYTGGQLTVVADNSALPEILRQIGRATGAKIEGTLPSDSERVFGQFGPGDVRDVLNALLDGSRYDYILVGTVDNPGDVQQLILTQRGGSLQGVSTANAPAPRPNPSEDEEPNEPAIAPQVAEPSPPPPPAQTTEPAPGQQQVKTPEQLLQELQRLRQQQQQQQPQLPR
ncbi:MAG: hypothetical protein JOZ10_05040 [Acidobacteria bacterium]|nr:hypothetical protein [Acidobacteriota bacterium]MBV9147149.1 hypothetical protein [Acidobacteriota bacterium]MBV9435061.1 hypothetical protein [Acidobacteriota bacterium]